MPRIVLFVTDFGHQPAQSLATLRTIAPLGLMELRQQVVAGRPILDRELFVFREPEFPDQVVAALRQLEEFQVSYEAYYLSSATTFQLDKKHIYIRLTASSLHGMLLERQRSLVEGDTEGYEDS